MAKNETKHVFYHLGNRPASMSLGSLPAFALTQLWRSSTGKRIALPTLIEDTAFH